MSGRILSTLLLSILFPFFVLSTPPSLKIYKVKVTDPFTVKIGAGTGMGIEAGVSGYLYFSYKDSTRRALLVVIKSETNHSFARLEKSFPEGARALFVVLFLPEKMLREEVIVEAFRYPEKMISLPAAEIVKGKKEIRENLTDNISDALSDAGVTQVGMGGLTKAIAVRGLARHRSLVLVDGTRVNSDRRTGASAHFLSPFLVDHVEVIKGPTSVFYGSDSIAGVVNLHTLNPDLDLDFFGNLVSGYSSNNKRRSLYLAVGKGFGSYGFISAFDLISADDYSSPLGKVTNSGYNRENFFFKGEAVRSGESFSITLLQSHGWNIGKPRWRNPDKLTWYPKEDHLLFKGEYRRSSFLNKELGLRFDFYVHPYTRDTHTEKWGEFLKKKEEASISTFDYGFSVSFDRTFKLTRLIFGIETQGRTNFEAKTDTWYFNEAGEVERELHQRPVIGGSKTSTGVFFSLDYATKRFDVTLGGRLEEMRTSAHGWGDKRNNVLSGFLGGSIFLKKNIVFYLSAGRAFRSPGLSELYYSGITGRGYVVGNPDLSPEISYNLEGGFKFFEEKAFLGLYLFSYWIHDMIERYPIGESTYTYGNIEEGILRGLEIEWEVVPLEFVTISGNLISYKGTTPSGDSLNDIPPLKLFIKIRAKKGILFSSIEYTHQWALEKPGPSEIPIDAFDLITFRAGVELGGGLLLNVAAENILDQTIFARPDPDAPPEPSRTFKVAIQWKF